MRASYKGEDTLGASADHLVSEEHPAEDERPIRVERVVPIAQAALRDAISGIPWLIEDAETALVTAEGHNGVKMAKN